MEILKERAEHIRQDEWRHGVTSFLKKVETVNRNRNIACHTPPVLENGTWTLKPLAAAKMLKRLDVESKTLTHFWINDLRNAISVGETALAEGVNLLENFKRLHAEVERRKHTR